MIFFNKNNINFEYEKRFDWVGRQSLDFYLPEYNIAIECQGEQHFKPIEYFGGEEGFKKIIKNDLNKFEKCLRNNIKLFYYIENEKCLETNKFVIYKYNNIILKENIYGENDKNIFT